MDKRRYGIGDGLPAGRPGRVPALLLALMVGTFGLALAGCLDVENPNAPTEEEVLTSTDGIIAAAVGVQQQYASQVEELIQGSALVTDAWGTDTRSLPSYRSLFLGPAVEVDDDLGVVLEPWSTAYDVVTAANDVLDGAPGVELSPGLEAGILAVARTFKAMALGALIQQFEAVPIDVRQDAPVPQPRDAVLAEVLGLLEAARSDLAGVSDDQLTTFRSRVLGEGLDLENTIDAMLARFYLLDGQHQAAIEAAGRVDQGVLSVLSYTATERNPVENLMLQLIYTAPLASFGAEAEPGDGRPAFWVDASAEPRPGNPADSLLLPPRQYATPTDPFPLYLPDEMDLIRAEAYTRLGQFNLARQEINEVRTQSSSPVEEPVAGLPALPPGALDTEAELLAQIAYERRYELYLQGLRWDDTRRLGEENTVTPVVDFFPIPQQECETNPNAGC